MSFTNPYRQHNYIGEFSSDSAALVYLQASKWDSAGNGTGNPQDGMLYYDTTLKLMKLHSNGAWVSLLSDQTVLLEDLTLYVDGDNGSDAADGLAWGTAKKTLAFLYSGDPNALPRELNAAVTVLVRGTVLSANDQYHTVITDFYGIGSLTITGQTTDVVINLTPTDWDNDTLTSIDSNAFLEVSGAAWTPNVYRGNFIQITTPAGDTLYPIQSNTATRLETVALPATISGSTRFKIVSVPSLKGAQVSAPTVLLSTYPGTLATTSMIVIERNTVKVAFSRFDCTNHDAGLYVPIVVSGYPVAAASQTIDTTGAILSNVVVDGVPSVVSGSVFLRGILTLIADAWSGWYNYEQSNAYFHTSCFVGTAVSAEGNSVWGSPGSIVVDDQCRHMHVKNSYYMRQSHLTLMGTLFEECDPLYSQNSTVFASSNTNYRVLKFKNCPSCLRIISARVSVLWDNFDVIAEGCTREIVLADDNVGNYITATFADVIAHKNISNAASSASITYCDPSTGISFGLPEYDNTTSGLTAKSYQDAIDELAVASNGSSLSDWVTLTAYTTNQEVIYLNLRFRALSNHTAAASFFTDLNLWECISNEGFIVNQTSHGLVSKDVIYETSGTWAKARANAIDTLSDPPVIVLGASTNYFLAVQDGQITLPSHGLTIDQVYFLSDATPGLLTTTEPTSVFSFSNPILKVRDSSTLSILPYRPSAVGTDLTLQTAFDGGNAIDMGGSSINLTNGTLNLIGSFSLSAPGNAFSNTFTSGINSANATYTLPTAMPASIMFLQCTDAGVMSWATAITDDVKRTYLSAGIAVQPSWYDNGDGTADLGAGTVRLYDNALGSGGLEEYTLAAYPDAPFADNTLSYVVASYSTGTAALSVITDVTLIDETTVVPVYTVYRIGTLLRVLDWDHIGYNLATKLHMREVKTERFDVASGFGLAEAGTRNVVVGGGSVWLGGDAITVQDFTSATDEMRLWYHVASIWTQGTPITQYNNTQYDNGVALQSLASGKYAVNWIYRGVDAAVKYVDIVLGVGEYTLTQAVSSQPPPGLPAYFASHHILVGRIIVKEGDPTATQIDVSSDTLFGPAQARNHNDLSLIDGGDATYRGHLTAAELTTTQLLPTSWVDEQRYGIVAPLTTTTIAFNDSTYQFTLGSVGANWSYWRTGIRYTITGDKTVTLAGTPPTAGTYFVYIDATNGDLTASTANPWTLADTKVLVAIIAWDNAATPKYLLADERHSCEIHRAYHREHHFADGAELVTGGTVSDYVVNEGTPAGDDDNTFSIAETVFYDEDKTITCATLSDPSGAGGDCMTFTRTGATTYGWAWSDVPFVYTGGGYINYNVAGTSTQGQSGKFYCTYLFATNFAGDGRFINLMGRGEYPTLSEAEAENVGLFDMTGFPVAESILLYRFVWATDSSYTTKGKVRLASEPIAIMRSFVAIQNLAADKPVRVLNDLTDVTITSSTLAVDQSLFYAGNGQWVNKTGVVSAGVGIDFYDATPVINSRSVPAGLIQNGTSGNGIQVNTLSKTAVLTTEQIQQGLAINDTRAYAAWLYNTALGRTTIDAGPWSFNLYLGVNSTIAGRLTTNTRNVYQVVPVVSGAVTTTNLGANTKTATITSSQFAGTYFAANATNTTASYLQTPSGIYQISAVASVNSVTIIVPTGYVNETGVTFNVWNKLFAATSSVVTALSPAYAEYSHSVAAPAFTVAITDKLGAIDFVTSNNTTTLSQTYDGTARNSRMRTPLITLHNNLAGINAIGGNYQHLTDLQLSELTGGGSTTLHSHAAATPTTITVAAEASDTTCYPLLVTDATGNLAPKTHAAFGFNAATGSLGIGTVDLDGTPVAGRLTVLGNSSNGSTMIFVGRDNTEANVAWLDTDGKLGLGTLAAPGVNLDVHAATDVFTAIRAAAFGACYATVSVNRARGTQASPTAVTLGSYLGIVQWAGYYNTTTQAASAQIVGEASETWELNKYGANLLFLTTLTGAATPTERMSFRAATGEVQINTGLVPDANDGAYLGTTTLGWADLHLATGGVINWANSNVTLTHATGSLTLAATTMALGSTNITMSGSIGVTGTRVTKGWFTAVETNGLTLNGATSGTTALAANATAGTTTQTFQAVSGIVYCSGGTDVAYTDGGTGISTYPTRTIIMGANSASLGSGTGADAPCTRATRDFATNKQVVDSIIFPAAATAVAWFNFPIPDAYDSGTFIVTVYYYSVTAEASNFRFQAAMSAAADGEAIDVALGTTVLVTAPCSDTALFQKVATFGAITASPTPAPGHKMFLKLWRDPTEGSDNSTLDAHVTDIKIEFVANAWTD